MTKQVIDFFRNPDGNRVQSPTVWAPSKKIIDPMGCNPTLVQGIELEIEGLDRNPEARAGRAVPGMTYHEDNSLRNQGGEYVTYPMVLGTTHYVLDQFFKKNQFTEANYSERCSIHVHANVTNLTVDNLKMLLCIYQVMERILFEWVQGDRNDNIFCVPWYETVLYAKAFTSDTYLFKAVNSWKKYTALNLKPILTQGTVEFRHMPGTNDLTRIINWCDMIGALFRYATTHEFEETRKRLMGLNTSSEYEGILHEVFPDNLYAELTKGNYRELLEAGVINMKLAADDFEKNAPTIPSYTSAFDFEEAEELAGTLERVTAEPQVVRRIIDPLARVTPVRDTLAWEPGEVELNNRIDPARLGQVRFDNPFQPRPDPIPPRPVEPPRALTEQERRRLRAEELQRLRGNTRNRI